MTIVKTFADYLKTNNTGNMPHDMAVTFAKLSSVQADSLQLLRDMIVTKTSDLQSINDLMSTLRSYRPSTTDNASKAADTGTKSDLGTTNAESKTILAELEYWGVKVNEDDIDKSGGDSKPYQVSQDTYDQWLNGLSSASDTVTADIKQLETTTQSRLDQWSKNLDWVSSFIKQLQETLQAVIANFK